jgi:hypothetical protein
VSLGIPRRPTKRTVITNFWYLPIRIFVIYSSRLHSPDNDNHKITEEKQQTPKQAYGQVNGMSEARQCQLQTHNVTSFMANERQRRCAWSSLYRSVLRVSLEQNARWISFTEMSHESQNTTGDSFWPTLLECISYTPWRWPFKGWNMLFRIVLKSGDLIYSLWVHSSVSDIRQRRLY